MTQSNSNPNLSSNGSMFTWSSVVSCSVSCFTICWSVYWRTLTMTSWQKKRCSPSRTESGGCPNTFALLSWNQWLSSSTLSSQSKKQTSKMKWRKSLRSLPSKSKPLKRKTSNASRDLRTSLLVKPPESNLSTRSSTYCLKDRIENC